VSVLPKPPPHLATLVVGGVVLNQHGSLAVVAACQLLQEGQVERGIKDGALAIVELSLE
jgi:hypothetical protein